MPFFRKSAGGVQYLVVGLGNPGDNYQNTRHNAGFLALDAIAKAWNIRVDRKKYDALTGEAVIDGQKILLMKPQTFMNLSGVAVEKAASFYHIPPEHILVLFDDISLAPGRLRIRRKGTHGGHNGIRSIIDYLQSEQFPRIKIGVGERTNPNYDLADWVLSRFTENERKLLNEAVSHCPEIAETILAGNIEQAMSRYNS
jgi:PTH1 family peptidyl-tRNA hydrolase